ncbi:MAG: hypothetical protein AABZ30_04330 [Myxococcota bacterium]
MLIAASATLLTAGAPLPAHADGLTLSMTAGTGWQASSPGGRIQTNVMVAPGFEILGPLLRFDAGFVADLPDIEASRFDVQVRPSLVIELPVLPIYGRVSAGVADLLHGPVSVAFGPSIGVRMGVGGVSLLAEVGYIPMVRSGDFESVIEARAGVAFGI